MRTHRLAAIVVAALISATLCAPPLRAADVPPPGLIPGAVPMLSAEQRAEEILSQMTLDEKIAYIGGTNNFYIRAIPRLNLPEIKMSDGPMAARNDGPTTAYPAGIALAATWDTNMAMEIGEALGRDCRARGVNILLGPAVNIYRSPLCGRNFEYMGEDPFLASTMVAPMVQGIQSQGVLATVKHFACNNQEWDRNRISSEVDERTLHEIYFPAFRAAVQQGGVACVMTSYNLLNGVHCADNDYLMNQVLKGDWNFKGFVMSDWAAVHNGLDAANGGLDLEMPFARFMNHATLTQAINDGKLKETTIDDKVRRILRTIIAAGFLDRPQLLSGNPRNDPQNAAVALAGAREAIVLLKNYKHLLPLDRKSVKSIAVLGPNANPAVYCGGGSAFPRVFESVSIRDGIVQLAGPGTRVLTATNLAASVAAAKAADVAVVCVGFNQRLESEGRDRTFDLPAGQSNLIHAIAAVNKKTIVVINSGGGVAWAGWVDKTPAVLQAWYPGQSVGQAVAEILFGDVNPSGKLPATFEKKFEDNPSAPYYHLRADNKTPYTEGIFVGYRGYDEKDMEPEFCFGHGLSYTDFKYGKPQVSPAQIATNGLATVSIEVQNTGARAGDEVVQLYVHDVKSSVSQPPKELKGFVRVNLQPGETKTINLTLPAEQLAYWDVKTHAFVVEPGAYQLLVGSSSRDIRGKAKLEVVVAGK
jgi:beta-glucosidase